LHTKRRDASEACALKPSKHWRKINQPRLLRGSPLPGQGIEESTKRFVLNATTGRISDPNKNRDDSPRRATHFLPVEP
jgi:hypothetical protein